MTGVQTCALPILLFFLASLVFGMAFYSLYRVSAERAMDRAFEQGATNVREALAYVRRCGGTSFAAVGVGFAVVFALAVVEVLAGI